MSSVWPPSLLRAATKSRRKKKLIREVDNQHQEVMHLFVIIKHCGPSDLNYHLRCIVTSTTCRACRFQAGPQKKAWNCIDGWQPSSATCLARNDLKEYILDWLHKHHTGSARTEKQKGVKQYTVRSSIDWRSVHAAVLRLRAPLHEPFFFFCSRS